jgi:aminoglycoside phosphotransferase (APT) family kinase protein
VRSLEPETVSRWAEQLAARGYTPTPLAAGVEGAVFRLEGGTVAKVWNSRERDEILGLASFYEAVAVADLPFLTPSIFEVGDLGDATFSIERELPGAPLFRAGGESPPLESGRLRCVAEALGALAAVRPTEAMKQLPILDESDPLWIEGSFNEGLARLVTRRALPEVEPQAAAVVSRLGEMAPGPDGLVHGDLIPANILVDDDACRVTAVLDFGFLTTVGAPAFDAAVAANIFDMYGSERDASVAAMERMVADAFGYAEDMLAVYLAAYALTTMNMYGSESDGHFQWCAAVLRRPAVLEALGLG